MVESTPNPQPQQAEQIESRGEILSIPIQKIKTSPYQPRKSFDPQKLKALAKSLKDEGQLEPVLVREKDDAFELIFGERRLRAAPLEGITHLDARVIKTVSEAEAAAKGLMENLQREELDAIEEAQGFSTLNKLDPGYWTQEKIGNLKGKDQTYVSRSLALLELPEAVQDSMRQRILSREHGIELLRLNNANSQKSMALKAVKGGWSVKKLRQAIDAKLGSNKAAGKSSTGGGQPSEDPYANQWQALLNDPQMPPSGLWSIVYKEGVWNFQFRNNDPDIQALMARGLRRLAEVVEGTGADASQANPPSSAVEERNA